jgi:hypothetical protein
MEGLEYDVEEADQDPATIEEAAITIMDSLSIK